MKPTLTDWCGDYEGDGNEGHIERLYDALYALEAQASAAAIRRARKTLEVEA